MRLINADEHECWACVHHQNEFGKCDTWCDAGESFVLRDDVKEAKTAFDIEVVVKEVQDIGTSFCTTIHCNNECENCDHGSIMRVILDAIRKGGVK